MPISRSLPVSVLFLLLSGTYPVHGGIYKMMAHAMLQGLSSGWGGGGGGWHDDGWESKGVSFGLKSKGMTAIIPFPMPIPIFTKDKGGGGGGGGEKIKYIPVPVPSGGGGKGEDWW